MEKRKEIIKLNYCNVWKGFDINNNFFTNVAQKYFGGYEISDKPDFLIYSCFGSDHRKWNDCVKVFFTNEAVSPNFSECDYAIAFDDITFGERYMRKPVWFPDNTNCPKECDITRDEALNRKFCNFIYSNDKDGNAAKMRKDFAEALMKYKHIDCPGKVLNNMQDAIEPRDGNWQQGKIDFIRNYKFTIAFENSDYEGYTTEKMLDPLSAHSIPIYWGNPKVTKDFNENAFINCNGYENNFEKIIEKIIEIDNNDDLYMEMLNAKPMSDEYDDSEIYRLEEFVYNVFSKGNNPYNKDPRGFAKRMSAQNLSRKEIILRLLKK